MRKERIIIPKGTDIHNLSDFAEPGMNMCKFVSKYGNVGSSLIISEVINKADMKEEHKNIVFGVVADLQQSIKLLRKEGSCDCSKSW